MTDQKTELIKKLITALTEFIALAESEENKAPQPAGDGRLEMLTLKECAALVPGRPVPSGPRSRAASRARPPCS